MAQFHARCVNGTLRLKTTINASITDVAHTVISPGDTNSYSRKLEIRSVERGICPIATLYSLAAAFQHLTLL